MNYEKQATDFLEKTNTKLDVELADVQDCPIWGCQQHRINGVSLDHSHGLKYIATFTRSNRQFSIPFWTSIIDTYNKLTKRMEYGAIGYLGQQRGKTSILNNLHLTIKPTAYDILACISGDIWTCHMTHKDFCDNYGYSTDSIRAEKAYAASVYISSNILKMWNEVEIEDLAEIQ